MIARNLYTWGAELQDLLHRHLEIFKIIISCVLIGGIDRARHKCTPLKLMQTADRDICNINSTPARDTSARRAEPRLHSLRYTNTMLVLIIASYYPLFVQL